MKCLHLIHQGFGKKMSIKQVILQRVFDKQFVRDYLISIKWDMKPPAPELPEEVINKTSEKIWKL